MTITSSTAYDQKWVYGRNIYENIDYLVDTVFANYLSRPGVRQPIFTSYCDGQRVTCSGLSQWSSKYLGDQGYSAIEIIRYYFGNDMYINSADLISGVPSSYPGYTLSIGASGDKVRQLQNQLNRIARNYPVIPLGTKYRTSMWECPGLPSPDDKHAPMACEKTARISYPCRLSKTLPCAEYHQ